MKRQLALMAMCAALLGADHPGATRWTFEDAESGAMPAGWTAAQTGNGPGSVWKIVDDASAPAGGKVLAQTSSEGPGPLFNLCVADQPQYTDVELSVSLKPASGKIDQGGGAVWRYQDADNYYIARVNPLEDNFRLYKVIEGKRTQLATADVETPAGTWLTLRIIHEGNKIRCSLDGKPLLEAADESITKPGRVGLWTKADAVTLFDALSVAAAAGADQPPREASEPEQVLVVNTQDASISLVDLKSMKEVKRIPVGPRPYGIAVTRDAKTVAVGVEDEERVKFYSFPDFELKGSATIGRMFNDHIVLSQDGKSIFVANFYSDDVVQIDVESMTEVARIEGCSAPHVVKFGPLKKRLFVTCKKITGIAIVDPDEGALVKFHQLNVNPRSLTFSPDESKVYFGSFWVDGFFEMDAETGKVSRLLAFDPPAENARPQEVTYHGVEAVAPGIVLAANEGRSFVDAVNVETGKLLDRLTDVSKPCCIERIPGTAPGNIRVLVSNIGDGTLQFVEVSEAGRLKSLGRAKVGAAPKRVAFVPAHEQ